MARKRKTNKPDPSKVMRRVARANELANGGRPRPAVFADRRAVARRRACRGKVAPE